MKKIISLILTVMITASVCPAAFAVNETVSPVSTKDGFLDMEIEDMPYNADFFKIREDGIYSGTVRFFRPLL